MTNALLEAVPDHEPPIGDAVEDIFRRAEAIRRRAIRALLAAAVLAVAGVVAAGYVITTLLLPATPHREPAPAARTAAPADPVLEVIRPVLRPSGLRVVAREPARGSGWRRYRVLAPNGRSRGDIEISMYRAGTGLCFPIQGHPGLCARPERTPGGVAYVRYVADRDVNWQVNEVIAAFPDGRVIVVQATGERGTGTAAGGRPPLSALLAARLATDPRIAAGFGVEGEGGGGGDVEGEGERDRCDAACPVLKVPLRRAGG